MKTSMILLVFFSLISIPVYSENQQSLITFETAIEREVEADTAIIKIQVEKKDRSFSAASSECIKTLNLIKERAIKAGVTDKDIIIRNFNSYPNFNFFGKEYSVLGYIDIKVRDKNKITEIFQSIPDLSGQETRINSIEYGIEDMEKLKNEMIKDASKKILEKKSVYEDSFSIKLRLNSINETTSDIEQNYAIRNFSVSKAPLPGIDAAQPEGLASFPVKKVFLRLFVNFEIIK